jgi:hypothetical protein
MRLVLASLLLLACARLEAAVAVLNAGLGGHLHMDGDQVRDLLLGRITTWSDGSPVVIVLCSDPSGEEAVSTLTGRSTALLLRGWKRLVFSGTGAMPLLVSSVHDGMEQVSRHRGAILVLMAAMPVEGVRIVPLGR